MRACEFPAGRPALQCALQSLFTRERAASFHFGMRDQLFQCIMCPHDADDSARVAGAYAYSDHVDEARICAVLTDYDAESACCVVASIWMACLYTNHDAGKAYGVAVRNIPYDPRQTPSGMRWPGR